ncbi:MAG TPA: hypothetical protein VF159_12720 [Gemmatimonadaceae bacterium]
MSDEPHPEGDDEAITSITSGLQTLSRILGLRENFIIDLFKDPDDWSFVVKAHAFLEVVVCAVLAVHLQRRELDEVLAQEVEMKARIEMTKALAITTTEDRKAMYALGKLRNRLVHNAKDTNFTFADYFQNKDAKKNFCSTFGHGWADPIPGTNPPVPRADYVGEHPKFAVFQSVLHIALYVVREMSKVQTDRALEGLQTATERPDDPENS